MKTIFFTGGTSGLGEHAAIEFANEGNRVFALARTQEKADALIQNFQSKYPNSTGKIETIIGTLSSFTSIKNTCNELRSKTDHLDMLVNNAGVWPMKFNETEDGIEEIFQVNVLATLLLIKQLQPLLENGTDAKIINTSSGLHQGIINFEDIEWRKKKYSGFRVYRQSKLAVILLGRLLAKELQDKEIGIYSMHPGLVKTNLARHAGCFSRMIFLLMGVSVEKGSRTLLYLMRTPKDELTSGEYYAKSKVTQITRESNDMEMAEKLYKVSMDYLKDHLN